MTRWRCEACKVGMPWWVHQKHISGEKHAAAVDAARKEKAKRVSGTSSDEKRWFCTICKTEMQMGNRESHLSGKRHTKAAKENREGVSQESKAPGLRALESATQVSNTQQSSTQEPRSKEDENRWTCTICKEVMHIQGREFHLSSSYHATNAQVPRIQKIGNEWKCTVCDIKMESQNKGSHLSGKRHAIAAQSYSECNSNAASPSSIIVKLPPASTETGGSFKQSQSFVLDRVQELAKGIKVPHQATPQSQQKGFGGRGKNKKAITYQKTVSKTTSQSHLQQQTSDDNMERVNINTVQQVISEPTTQPASPPPIYTGTGPLDIFFRSFPGFPYDPSKSPEESLRFLLKDLGQWHDWDRNSPESPETWKDYENEIWNRYQAALTSEFNLWYGTEDDLTSWHFLCRAIGIQPLPATRKLCRNKVRNTHLNIVDLIQWGRGRQRGQVKIFATVADLREYSHEEVKFYKRDQSGQGVILRHLLRQIA